MRSNVDFFCADIVKAFKVSLSSIPWMDEKSAAAAAQKVTCFVLSCGTHAFLTRFSGRRHPRESWLPCFPQHIERSVAFEILCPRQDKQI